MKLIHALGIAAAYSLAILANGASIPVPDFSFEEPDVVDGSAAGFGTVIPGWTILYGGQSEAGVHDPLNAQYAGATGANGVLPGTAVGTQAAFIAIGANTTRMTTTNVTSVAANTVYLLTVAIGNPLDHNPGNVFLRLTINGSEAATTTIPQASIPDGTFTDFSAALGPFASTNSNIGRTLGIEFGTSYVAGSPFVVADFDNVRLTTTVPEPQCAGLLLVGATLVLRRRAAE
jgi:hypothetical protein